MTHKDEVITFKVDGALAEQLRVINAAPQYSWSYLRIAGKCKYRL